MGPCRREGVTIVAGTSGSDRGPAGRAMAGSGLVLDGDGALREMPGEALADAGSRVVGHAAGGEALERLARVGPDLIRSTR